MIFILAVVGIPYLGLIALTAIQGRGHFPNWSQRAIELGIDGCILGLGVSGALFGSRELRGRMGDVTAVIAIVVIFLDLTITGLCLHLRTEPNRLTEKVRLSLSIFFGVLILVLNVAIAWRYQ